MNQEDQQGQQKSGTGMVRPLRDHQPALIVVTGIMASGKSTIARLLAQRFVLGVHMRA
jgi:adenylylsulfate kinase-like enzyme